MTLSEYKSINNPIKKALKQGHLLKERKKHLHTQKI
jgi:hypothetical protein